MTTDGRMRTRAPVKLAASVGRHPTFRSVSRTLRKASVRVVNIMGAEQDGMAPLDDGDEEEGGEEGEKKLNGESEEQIQLPKLGINTPCLDRILSPLKGG